MTTNEILDVLADVMEMHSPGARVWLTQVVERLHEAGYVILPIYLTTREVAALRRRTSQSMVHERKRGEGPPYVVDGGKILYPAAALARWLDRSAPATVHLTEPPD
jgi:hypothetical protein